VADSPRRCFVPPLASLGARSPTELRHPRSTSLDSMPTVEAVRLFLAEDSALPAKIASSSAQIAQLVDVIASSLRGGA
jgi:N-acetylmuramic acid 6-phosphate (MurNAc-6-P) etherase